MLKIKTENNTAKIKTNNECKKITTRAHFTLRMLNLTKCR